MSNINLNEFRRSVFRCNLMGRCKGWDRQKIASCPIMMAGAGFVSERPKGLMIIARQILQGNIEYSKELTEVFFRCTGCRSCTMLCNAIDQETGGYLTKPHSVINAMKADAVEAGMVPPKARDFLEHVYKYSNPYGISRKKRDEFVRDTAIRQYKAGDEFLYYVGDVGSYDARAQDAARALGTVLLNAGVSFGILGKEESSDGNEVNYLGERDLFRELAEHNIRMFDEMGVKKVVTLSPHAYNAMKNDYPALGAQFEVQHYTQLLRDLIKNKKLNLAKQYYAKVVYHDSCFLGRHNDVYDAPREILSSINGVELMEMSRTRENSMCCGGGAGNFYTDILGGEEDKPSRIRVRKAYNTGATVLAVACPICLIMFADAVKVEGLEEKMTVMDISEILWQAC